MFKAIACGVALAVLTPSGLMAQEATSYDRGVEARLAGDPAKAVPLLEQWLAGHPEDVDARVQLGYAYIALDRPRDAETQFRTVLASAPNYTDASEGLAQIERRRSPGSDRPGFILFESAIAALDDGQEDWNEAGVLLSLPAATRDTFDLRGTWYERFGLEDTEVAALYTHRASDDTWLRFGAGGAPAADFRPEIGLSAGVDHRLADGPAATVVGVDAAWRKFPAQDVFNVSPAITRYLGGAGSFSLTARANALVAQGDKMRLGGSLRGDYAPGGGKRAFVGVAAGPDTDLGVVTDTYSLFAGGDVPLDESVSLTGSIAREWRDGPADRNEFRIGLKFGL